MSLIEFSDGSLGLVGEDGWVDEFDAVDTPALDGGGTAEIHAAAITIEPLHVTDTEVGND